jgi:hypothetical protein
MLNKIAKREKTLKEMPKGRDGMIEIVYNFTALSFRMGAVLLSSSNLVVLLIFLHWQPSRCCMKRLYQPHA